MIVVTHSLDIFNRSFLSAFFFAINVPIFFILSGYLYREKTFKNIFSSGVKNLLSPYLATVVIIGLIELIGHNFFPNWIRPINVLSYILSTIYGLGTNTLLPGVNITIPAIGAIWFLPAMFIGNLLFNLIFKIDKKLGKKNLFLLSCSLILAIIGFFLGKKIQLPWSFDAVLISQVFYCFGYLIKERNLVENGHFTLTLLSLLLWLVSAKSGFFYMNVSHADAPIFALLGAIGGSYFVMRISCLLLRYWHKWPIMQKFGKDSLVMLCFHLIDINAFSVGPNILSWIVLLTGNHYLGVLGMLVYRLLIILCASVIVPYIPIVRSFFFPRKFPFKVKDKRSLVKNSLR